MNNKKYKFHYPSWMIILKELRNHPLGINCHNLLKTGVVSGNVIYGSIEELQKRNFLTLVSRSKKEKKYILPNIANINNFFKAMGDK